MVKPFSKKTKVRRGKGGGRKRVAREECRCGKKGQRGLEVSREGEKERSLAT